ncbi:MAG TPA: ATP-binding protein [Methylomirabilota bacterium]|nr:ATP-binding protein [Methylomirabilota bacterium]
MGEVCTFAPCWLQAGILCVDREGLILSANSELRHWCGLGQIQGQSLTWWSKTLGPQWDEALWRIFQSDEDFIQETLVIDSEALNGTFAVERTRVEGLQHIRLANVVADEALSSAFGHEELPESPATRELLRKAFRSQAQLESISNKWPGVIFSQRADFTFSFASERVEKWTGVTLENLSRSPDLFWQIVHEDDAQHLRQEIQSAAQRKEGFVTTYRVRHLLTGRVTYILEHRDPIFSANGLILGYEGVWLDVSRQTIAEKRLQNAAWKETLAVITMGLAHDFSNMMAGIHSLAETFQAQLTAAHPHHEVFALIRKNSMQASHLVQRILSLHQGKVGERNYHDLNELVTDTSEVLKKILPRGIELRSDLAAEQLPLYVDRVELRQALINMALNAADAVRSDGTIKISSRSYEEAPSARNVQGKMPAGPVICLSIADDGHGIHSKHLGSIFDPFFTTKPSNKGSGLGLYNARLFVEKHGGAISVESVQGVGTTFRLWLPKADFTEAERQSPSRQARRAAILLITEKDCRAEMSPTFLRQHGYYVATAEDVASARDYLLSPDYTFDAVMVQASGSGSLANSALELAREQKSRPKAILHVVQSNPDELETNLLRKSDLIIGPESGPTDVIRRLDELLRGGNHWA